MNQSLRDLVHARAKERCEYCHLPEFASLFAFQVEHIIAIKHNGPTKASNLCLACQLCNLSKSSNLTGIDPSSKKLTRLFNPRTMKWTRHFELDGALLVGLTAIGRTTVNVLNMNDPDRVNLRIELIKEGAFG